MAYKRKTILNQQNFPAKRKKIQNQHNWADFPCDLLEIVLTKLSFRNKFCFQRVCSSWLAAGQTHLSCLHRKIQFQSPSLMFPSNHVLDNSFYNLEENTLQQVSNFPTKFIGKKCLGSSNGWLVFFDKEHIEYSLFNPVLNGHVKIQNLSELEYTTKVVLWSDPIFGDGINYGIVAIYTVAFIHSYIAYARCGDSRWSELDNESQTSYHDIVCRNNIVYALTSSCYIEAWNFKAAIPSKILNIQPSLPRYIIQSRKTFGKLYMSQFYLIESQADLFLVTRVIGYHVCEYHGLVVEEGDMLDYEHQCCEFNYRTMFLHVFKLDFDKRQWTEVENLGDGIIFVGGNHSAMVHAQDAKVYEKNSIYFTDDNCELKDIDDDRGGHDAGIYSLEDRSIKQLFSSIQVKPPPFWVVPRST